MIGGAGNDTYGVDDLLDVVVEAANEGTDTVETFLAALSIEAHGQRREPHLHGSSMPTSSSAPATAGNNVITGGDLADTLSGLGGNDTLNGGLGADTLIGGDGNDTYVVDDAGDVVNETTGLPADVDTRPVLDQLHVGGGSSKISTLPTMTPTSTAPATAANNVIIGNDGANQLFGGGNNDTLTGNDGNDVLDGGDGNDTINGGNDNDTIIGGAGNDTIDVGGGFNTIVYNTINFGADIISSFDAAGGTPATQDRIDLSAFGITAANFATRVFIAPSGANTLITVRDAALASIGTIQVNGVTSGNFSVTDFTLATAPTAAPINGTAAANNPLNGTAAANTINGLGGNDVINGLGGDDVVNGDEGADIPERRRRQRHTERWSGGRIRHFCRQLRWRVVLKQ